MQELKRNSDFFDQVIEEFYPPEKKLLGYKAPWKKVSGKILFRPNEISIWTGFSSHGKSQFLGQIMLSMMQQGAKVCVASLELKPTKLIARLMKQATAINLPSSDYSKEVMRHYNDNMWLFNVLGNAKSSRLLEVFKYARQRYGIDTFVIDSFAKLDIADNDHKGQKTLMNALCDLKNEYDCQIHMVVHPIDNLDESNPPSRLVHNGTGVIADIADNCFSVWRNKEKELLLQKQQEGFSLIDKELEKLKTADCIWSCDKQRNGGWEGAFDFWFDKTSSHYLEDESQHPKPFVEWAGLER